MGRDEILFGRLGMDTGWVRRGSSLESSGATPPGSPSWRPGLGQDGGVWGPRPGLTHLGSSPSSPWRLEMKGLWPQGQDFQGKGSPRECVHLL